MDNFLKLMRRRRIGSLRTLVFMFQNNSPSEKEENLDIKIVSFREELDLL